MALDNKVCIVTGGGSGIGEATALRMAREGAKLVLVGRTKSKVEAVAEHIVELGGTSSAWALDVADHDAVSEMVSGVKDDFGRIDILVNAAGHSSRNRSLLTVTPQEIRAVLDSNLVGTIYCTQAVIPTMLDAGGGTIINVSSLAGVTPGLLGGMAYSAAKAAVNNFTDFLNAEFKNTGIRASVVIPGEVDTPILDTRPVVPSAEARATMATAEDVAEAITMIAMLSAKTAVPELIIRPTNMRDHSNEWESRSWEAAQ
jgi:NADP-dependent 3-hydroxy acid dehydrogenase YdfG